MDSCVFQVRVFWVIGKNGLWWGYLLDFSGKRIFFVFFMEGKDLNFWREIWDGYFGDSSLRTLWSDSLECIQNLSLHHTIVATLRLTEMIPTVN